MDYQIKVCLKILIPLRFVQDGGEQNVWTGLNRSMQFTFNCSKNFLVGTFLFMFHPPLSKYFFVFEINCVFKNLDGKNS